MSFLYGIYIITNWILSSSTSLIIISLSSFVCFLALWSVKSTLIIWLLYVRDSWVLSFKRLIVRSYYTRNSTIVGFKKFKFIIILRSLYYNVFKMGPWYFLFILPYKLKTNTLVNYRFYRPKYRTNYEYCFGIVLSLLVFYHLFLNLLVNQHVLLLFYLCLGGALYLLMSGFIYFAKLYSYSRYTSFIQDFWRVTLTSFWLLESTLLLFFLYVLSLGDYSHNALYQPNLSLGSEYLVYFSTTIFVIKHIPLMLIICLFVEGDCNYTEEDYTLSVLLGSFILLFILIDEFFLFYHVSHFFEPRDIAWNFEQKALVNSVESASKLNGFNNLLPDYNLIDGRCRVRGEIKDTYKEALRHSLDNKMVEDKKDDKYASSNGGVFRQEVLDYILVGGQPQLTNYLNTCLDQKEYLDGFLLPFKRGDYNGEDIIQHVHAWFYYFWLIVFLKVLHILFCIYFSFMYINSTNNNACSSDVRDLREGFEESIKAAMNFNLIGPFIWLGVTCFWPILNRTLYSLIYLGDVHLFSLPHLCISELVRFLQGLMLFIVT